jgi:hypothetical protein
MRLHGKLQGRLQATSRQWGLRAVACGVGGFFALAGASVALLSPAQAQFWSPFSQPRRPPAPIQQQYQQPQSYNPFGGFFGQPEPPRPVAPPDNTHAPPQPPRKADQPPTTSIVVMGDAMADWLASGLEDAYSERPEMGIVRKGRIGSGLIRYDPKRDVDWAQTAREIIAAEKPKFIVMMIGTNDHQVIRERAPTPATTKPAPASGKPGAAPVAPAAESAPTEDVANPDAESPDQPAADAGRSNSPTGPFEFHTEQWEAAYIKRIDATIVALKSANVPVFWVGLPAQRGPKATTDSSYLNELYRARAERAGIVFVDVWDGFVDEQGRFAPQGPDFEGQIRRLRSADGVYFTKAGARKLAHYVEREIDRSVANRALPLSLPSTVELSPPGKPGGSSRPLAGPVIPLTVSTTGTAAEELLGGAKPAARPASPDPLVTRVLTKGEPIPAPSGRADDFSWPRGNAGAVPAVATSEPTVATPIAATMAPPAPPATAAKGASKPPATQASTTQTAAPAAASAPKPAATTAQLDGQAQPDEKPKPKKPAPAPSDAQAPPRPPAAIRPFATIPNIFR